MKKILFLIWILLFTAAHTATIHLPSDEPVLVPKEDLIIEYAGFLLDEPGGDLYCKVQSHLLESPVNRKMNLKEQRAQCGFDIPDEASVLLISFYRNNPDTGPVDNNDGEHYEVIVQENGKPVRSAHQTLALSWTGMSSIRDEDLDQAQTEIEKELDLYPDNYSARLLYYSILLRIYPDDIGTQYQIRNEIRKIVKGNQTDNAVLNFAMNGYRMLGLEDDAEDIEKQIIAQNPDSEQAALKQLDKILKKEEDPEKRYQALSAMLPGFIDLPVSEYILSQMATTAIAMTDSSKMTDTGDALLDRAVSPAGASALAGLAGVFSENSMERIRAVAYAEKAVKLIEEIDHNTRPPELSKADWQDQINTTLGRYQDILGWALFQLGRSQEALPLLEKSTQAYLQAGPFFHLAEVYAALGRMEDAHIQYARAAAFGGEIGKWAEEILDQSFESRGESQAELASLKMNAKTEIENRYNQFILKKRNIRPAPDFELDALQGGLVRLSDQQGAPVVLCFWSTWSKSSLPVLKALHNLSKDVGDDILFLTVAVEPDRKRVYQYLKKYKFFLPALINEGTDQLFGIQGVPVIFVIDAKGNIHFEHKGYRPDLKQVLTVELDDIR